METKRIPKVYCETSFWSYLTGGTPKDEKTARWQWLTRRWWEEVAPLCEIYVSEYVVEEALKGNAEDGFHCVEGGLRLPGNHHTGGFFRAHGGFWPMKEKSIDWSDSKYSDPLEEIYAVRQMISAEYGHDIRKLAAAMARKTARAEALGMNYGEYCLWLLEQQAVSPLCACESGSDTKI